MLSLLLLLGLTVTECTFYSNSVSAYSSQVAVHISKQEDIQDDNKLYVYRQGLFSIRLLDLSRISYSHLKRAANLKVCSAQKVSQMLYQRIKATNAESAFLTQVLSSQNSYSNLYMA